MLPDDRDSLLRTPTWRQPRLVILASVVAASLGLGAVGHAVLVPSPAVGADGTAASFDVAALLDPALSGATLLGVARQEAPTDPIGEPLSVADVAERANPAVVTIINRAATAGGELPANLPGTLPGDEATVPVGSGSGFIIDAGGHVVTNNHVVVGADALEVQFFDGTETTATIVGRDELQDLAVLQLDLTNGQAVPGTLAFGDSDAVRAGDDVVAIGSSLGEFTNTVSRGIIGHVDRTLGGLPNLIQHDAPIYPGNSGGPLLNLAGEVIGINVAGMGNIRQGATPAQLAFAIDSNAASGVVAELIASGVVRRPWLGISGGPIEGGHLVAEVLPETPAMAAGLQADDLIIAIDGERIDGNTGLLEILSERDPGETVAVTVERDGDEQDFDVILGERPADTD